MFAIKQENRGYFCGMVYHGECGWHCGIQHRADIEDMEIVAYYTKEQATQQAMFMAEMFHEQNLIVVEI